MNWAANAEQDEKMEFLKSLVSTCTFEEIKGVYQLAKRAKEKLKFGDRKRAKFGRKKNDPKSSSSSKCTASEKVVAVPQMVADPTDPPETSTPVTKEIPWWENFTEDQFVALDCEFVSVPIPEINKKGKRKYKIRAAKVGIVNYNGDVVYEKMTKMQRSEYHVTYQSTKLNGITQSLLEKGDVKFSQLQAEVEKIIEGKVVVTVAGTGDFNSLELSIGDYETFDLHTHFYKMPIDGNGVVVRQPIGLKKIYNHYFPNDTSFQKNIHSPVEDARATMKIFREVYTKIKVTNIASKTNFDPFPDDF